jgi:hypothetical protein
MESNRQEKHISWAKSGWKGKRGDELLKIDIRKG